jgi:hypothetical protein
MRKPKCTCKRVWEPEYEVGCTEKIDSKCVIYRPEGGSSLIKDFIGINTRTSIEVILETFDSKLASLFLLELTQCSRDLLDLPQVTNVKLALSKLLDHVCVLQDKYVKVTSSDTAAGFLYNKITTGECVQKRTVTDLTGTQTLEIYLDYECIAAKLPTVIEVNCCNQGFTIETSTNEICNSTLATLTAYNCSDTVVWYKNGMIIGTGNTYTGGVGNYYAKCGSIQSNTITVSACSCEPVWSDKIPVEIYCGAVIDLDPCKLWIKQSNQCNNLTQWVEYTGSGSINASQCDGCVQTPTPVPVPVPVPTPTPTPTPTPVPTPVPVPVPVGSPTPVPVPVPTPTPVPTPVPVPVPVPTPVPVPVPTPTPTPVPVPVTLVTYWEIQSCPTSGNGMDSGTKTTDTDLTGEITNQRVTIGSNEYHYLGTTVSSGTLPGNFVAGTATIVSGQTGCSEIIP